MQAIVLSRQDFKEYDQIISLYTREEGRRDLLARGIKKIVSKNAAQLEPCSVVEVGVAHGKDLDIVTNVQIEKYFPQIRRSYYKSLLGLWATDLTKVFFTSPERDERVFLLLSSWLAHVDAAPQISPYILDALVLRSLSFLGLTPVIDHCAECERVRAGETFFFSPSRGGIVCSSCRNQKTLPSEVWYRVSKDFLQGISEILFSPWEQLSAFSRDKKAYVQLHRLTLSFVQYHHEANLKDWWKIAKLSKFFI